MAELTGSRIKEFIETLQAKKRTGNGKIIIFAGAAISLKAPSRMPSADALLDDTLNDILETPILGDLLIASKYKNRIRTTITELFKKRLFPPELFYDAIYEHLGNQVFRFFDRLKSGQPNIHHRLLVSLLEENYVDYIITTNFDTLLEQAIRSTVIWRSFGVRRKIWKIHGNIDKPDTMVATFRRVGQGLFDQNMLGKLKDLLTESHVLFIGYGGTDVDLLPILVQARMKSVFWIVYNQEEYNSKANKEPWITIGKNSGGIKWIIDDLNDSALAKRELELVSKNQPEIHSENRETVGNRLKIDTTWLPFSESTSALLQILYNIAGASLPSEEEQNIWDMIGGIIDVLLTSPRIDGIGSEKLKRDLHAFRAETYMQKRELADALDHLVLTHQPKVDDMVQARAMLNEGVIFTDQYTDQSAKAAEHLFLEAMLLADHLPEREPGRQALLGRCHANLAVLRMYQKRPFESSKHFESAAKLFKESGSLFEYIELLIDQVRYFMLLGDTVNTLKYFFMAEAELRSFPAHALNEKLRTLQQELSNTGLDISSVRSQLSARRFDTES